MSPPIAGRERTGKLSNHSPKKSTLHGGRLGISWSHPESEGKLQAEPIEERGLGRVRPDEAPEPQFPALGGREGHIRALDAVSE